MHFGFGERLLAAFACVVMLTGQAAASDAASSLDALRDIAVRADAATRETLAAHAAHRAVAPAAATAAAQARAELDAIARASAGRGDASFERKRLQVEHLLRNLERAEAAAPDAALPPIVAGSDPKRTAEVALSASHGGRCASALAIAPGGAVGATLAPAGADGSTLWLRIAASSARVIRLDTAPTALDTEITLFGATCPSGEDGALARNDDAFGLAAAIAIDTGASPGFHYARVRNLARRGGRVVARVEGTGAIVGRVTDERSGEPIAANVIPATPDGYFLGGAQSDPTSGLYLLAVDPGEYYVSFASYGAVDYAYVPELYPDAPCSGGYYVYSLDACDVPDATLLTVAQAQEIAGIDVALNIGARIAGVVRDAASGLPLASAALTVFDASGNSVTYSNTDATGRFVFAGLLSGEYYVEAAREGYGSQLWNHVACGGDLQTSCNALDGTPLPIVRNQLTTGIDFDLPRQAHVHATVSTRNGDPYPADGWTLWILDASGTYVGAVNVYGSATQDSFALAPGTYYVYATAQHYFGQVWNGVDCPVDCTAVWNQGTPVTVAEGDVANVAFSLLHVPTVSGTITDATTLAPIANASVTLVATDPFGPWATTTTDGTGRYTVEPAASGSYYVLAGEQDHRGTLYPDVPCIANNANDCDLGAATAITVTYAGPDVTGIDIAMPADGSVSGHVELRSPEGMDLDPIVPRYMFVQVYDGTGVLVASAISDINGTYEILHVPPGTYYASAAGDSFGQVYPGIDCSDACSPLGGGPIAVASGAETAGIDFDPVPYGYIFGRVTDADGAPIGGVAIDLWQNDGTHCGDGVTNASGYYAASDTVGFCDNGQLLSTDADATVYENEVYDDLPCPVGPVFLGLCTLAGATPVPFPSTASFAIADFELGPRTETIFADGFDP